jgi:hypothetical protein
MKYLVWSAEHCSIPESKGLLMSGHNLPSAAVNIWLFEKHTKCYKSMFSVKGLSTPTKKLSQNNKLGSFAGQEMCPSLVMTGLWNKRFMVLSEFLTMCKVAPSCWNHVFLLTCGKRVNSCKKRLNHVDLVDQFCQCHIFMIILGKGGGGQPIIPKYGVTHNTVTFTLCNGCWWSCWAEFLFAQEWE